MLGGMADVTKVLDAAAAGDPTAAAELLPLVYDELRKLAAARMSQENPGQTLQGQVLSEGMTDLQIRTDDKKIRILRKADGNRYRLVTSQTDWPSYNGDPSGNRYSKLTQIDKSNVGRLAPRWIFPMPGATTIENTPLVVDGVMYVAQANESWALDAGTGKSLWRFQAGGQVIANPITYLSDGQQQVAIAVGSAIFSFGLD